MEGVENIEKVIVAGCGPWSADDGQLDDTVRSALAERDWQSPGETYDRNGDYLNILVQLHEGGSRWLCLHVESIRQSHAGRVTPSHPMGAATRKSLVATCRFIENDSFRNNPFSCTNSSARE